MLRYLVSSGGNPRRIPPAPEKFQNDYANDNSKKKYELQMDRCKYYCIFNGDNGEIQLDITHQRLTCYVMLSYFDNANQEKLRKQIMDDL